MGVMTGLAKPLLGFLVLICCAVGAQKSAKVENTLFSPSSFTRAPLPIRQQLERMHCRVFGKENLIRGQFAADKQDDWAALCVNGDHIQPVVIWGGKVQCDARPAPARDYKELMADPMRDAYIATAEPKKIAMYADSVGGVESLPSVTHAGLEVGDEQASVIYYCQQGKWVQLTGAD